MEKTMHRWLVIRVSAALMLNGFAVLGANAEATPGSAFPAAPGSSISVGDGVAYDIQAGYGRTYSYRIVPPTGTDSWTMTVEASGGDGNLGDSYDVVDSASATGSSILAFDYVDVWGEYKVLATITYTDNDAGASRAVATEKVTDTFFMRRHATRTVLKVSTRTPTFNSWVHFTISSFDKQPNGFVPRRNRDVGLQVKYRGRWRDVDDDLETGQNGRAGADYRYDLHGVSAVRAVTIAGFDNGKKSFSRPVIVNARR